MAKVHTHVIDIVLLMIKLDFHNTIELEKKNTNITFTIEINVYKSIC